MGELTNATLTTSCERERLISHLLNTLAGNFEWKAEKDLLFRGELEYQLDVIGPERTRRMVAECVRKCTFKTITVNKLREYIPAAAERKEPNWVCRLCDNTRWKISPDSTGHHPRFVRCDCPVSERMPREKVSRPQAPDVNAELRNIGKAVFEPSASAEEVYQGLGFWYEKQGEAWLRHGRDDSGPTVSSPSQYEVILWRAFLAVKASAEYYKALAYKDQAKMMMQG